MRFFDTEIFIIYKKGVESPRFVITYLQFSYSPPGSADPSTENITSKLMRLVECQSSNPPADVPIFVLVFINRLTLV